MIANRDLGIEDYIAIARRRAAIVLVPAVLGPLIGVLISYAITPKYTSRALLLVVEQVVPTDYFKPIITEHVSDRMTVLQQNVLSPTRLQPLVRRLGLARNGKSEDAAIEEIRNNVIVTRANLGKPSGNSSGGTADVPGFYVWYTADNGLEAQRVCSEVTSLLLAENLEVRSDMARSTTDFLSHQLDQAKMNLDEMDKKLAVFRTQHIGRLPGDADNDLKILSSLESQLDASTQVVNRLLEDKSSAEALLQQRLAAVKSVQAAPTYSVLRGQLIKLQEQLVLLQAKYTDDYPNVVRTKHQIAELQGRLAEMDALADQSDDLKKATVPRSGVKPEPPEIVRLREQVRRDEKMIERVTETQKQLPERIATYQSRLAMSPEIEEEYKQLTRDSATAHNVYNTLLANKSTAEMQTEMELKQQGEQIKLLAPASFPVAPSSPDRSRFALYGLGGGLGLGLAIALWLEFMDKSIRDEGDVWAALELPMLASMPWAGGDGERKGWTNTLGGRVAQLLSREKAAHG
jgi:polysaccharide chain length determinant protein (PEP-CTERM system associated)